MRPPRARRRAGIAPAAWPALALGLALAGAPPSCSPPPPRAIVLIVVDTLRRDAISPYGAETKTPVLQALADRGQVFRDLQASFHQTTMSMGALFTGRTPSLESRQPEATLPWTGRTWCGLARFAASGAGEGCIPPDVETLPERLRRAGWFTIGVVSNELLFAPSGFERGFDVWREVPPDRDQPSPGRAAPRAAPAVLEAVRGALARAPSERLFLYLHYIDVHDYLPALPMRRSYARVVEKFDEDLGRLFDALERAGVLEDAVVVLTSDHGERLGERHALRGKSQHRGNPSFQTVLDVPLIVAPPVDDADPARMLRSQDLASLVLRIAGLPALGPEPAADGLRDEELLLTERRFLTYRDATWKSVFYRADPERAALFDLANDPGETRNVIDLHPEIAERHRARARALASGLATDPLANDAQTDADRDRLRALGYLE